MSQGASVLVSLEVDSRSFHCLQSRDFESSMGTVTAGEGDSVAVCGDDGIKFGRITNEHIEPGSLSDKAFRPCPAMTVKGNLSAESASLGT